MILFATGFPGFIARTLIPKLTQDRPYDRVILLVEERFAETARQAAAQLLPDCEVEIVPGDISAEGMGISEPRIRKMLRDEPSEWWHLAAIYRLEVGLAVATKVNVEGTRIVLEEAKKARALSRLNYVSTAYVSGLATGLVREDDLPQPEPKNFKNFYELTKNQAEWLVRGAMPKLPVTIYRYGIVTGDSKTGATEKFDGPFFTIKYFHRFGHMPLPIIGDMTATINMVPVDFVVDATVSISGNPNTVGKCFQIVDPRPIAGRELFTRVAAALGCKVPRWTLPPWVMDWMMKFKPVRKRIQIPKEAMVYMNHSVTYDPSNTLTALNGTGIACPPAAEYIPRLVDFYLKNRHRKELHLTIE